MHKIVINNRRLHLISTKSLIQLNTGFPSKFWGVFTLKSSLALLKNRFHKKMLKLKKKRERERERGREREREKSPFSLKNTG